MGISGFHQYTKQYLEHKHVREFSKLRIGVDASAWLHRGSVSYAWDIHNKSEPWNQLQGAKPPWVEFPLRMLNMLMSHDIQPVLVFDGRSSPAKAPTSKARREKKDRARQKALNLLEEGRAGLAARIMQQAFDVTRDMARDLIGELKARQIEFVVAPYEADAQLAYLCQLSPENGGVDAVITEDSDLVAYGCDIILFKCSLDGTVQQLRREVLFGLTNNTRSIRIVKEERSQMTESMLEDGLDATQDTIHTTASQSKTGKTDISFEGWTDDQLCLLCILSGCDFLPSLMGMGFNTAYKLVNECKTLEATMKKLQHHTRWARLYTPEYHANVVKAFQTFRYSLVFDMKASKPVYMRPLPEALVASEAADDISHLGPMMDHDFLVKLAQGKINPDTGEEYIHKIASTVPSVDHAKKKREGIFAYVMANYQQKDTPHDGRDGHSPPPQAAPAPVNGHEGPPEASKPAQVEATGSQTVVAMRTTQSMPTNHNIQRARMVLQKKRRRTIVQQSKSIKDYFVST